MLETAFDITQPYLGLIQKYRPKPEEAEVDMDTQRKIAKGNAVAEAFRLLIDAVGGAKGANIVERKEPANAVMGAVDKYWKTKEASKGEQSAWDKLEAGASIDALKNKASMDYASQKQKEAQDFQAAQTEKQQTFQAGEAEKNRQQQTEELKIRSDQFLKSLGLQGEELAQRKEQANQELGFKRETAKTDAEIEREKIAADRERVQAMYPYGRLSGLNIADEETDQIIKVPDDSIEQVIAFMEADPNVQDNIGFIKAKFNNLGSTQEVKYLVTQNFGNLTPETKQKIRALSAGSSSFKPQSQTPTIKTDKGSTVVKVEQPAANQNALSPEQVTSMQKVIQAKNYTPEVKRAAIYRYLLEQGYDDNSAKVAAERVYQSITGK